MKTKVHDYDTAKDAVIRHLYVQNLMLEQLHNAFPDNHVLNLTIEQILTLNRGLMDAFDIGKSKSPRKKKRKPMSPAKRKHLSRAMRAVWEKKKAGGK